MLRLFVSLPFILANSVVAQATVLPMQPGVVQLSLVQWNATHAGEVELGGMPVVAALERAEKSQPMREAMAHVSFGETSSPLTPVIRKEFRLSLALAQNNAFRDSFLLESHIAFVDGTPRVILASPANAASAFHFTAMSQPDGTYLVRFTRQNAGAQAEEGSFVLNPIPQLLQK